jgi:hypothetical protein
MSVYELKTLKDIYDAVREEVKVQAGDTSTINRIKRDINLVYLHEVVPADNWYWLRKTKTLQTQPAMFLGTASVISNSDIVTLTESPSYSREGWMFSTNKFSEVYRIKTHVDNSNILILDRPYMGTTNTAARYDIWTDSIPLPSEFRETIELGLELAQEDMVSVGYQEFRQIQKLASKSRGRPAYYTTTSYKDPNPFSSVSGLPASQQRKSDGLNKYIVYASTLNDVDDVPVLNVGDKISVSGAGSERYNGEFIVAEVLTTNTTNDTIRFTGELSLKEALTSDSNIIVKKRNVEGAAERYREILIHPSLLPTKTSLKLDGIIHASPLENDTDEPLLPLEDRISLFYGACAKAWARERNPEEAARNYQLFQNKLALMKSKMEDGMEFPRLQIDREYLRVKRRQF